MQNNYPVPLVRKLFGYEEALSEIELSTFLLPYAEKTELAQQALERLKEKFYAPQSDEARERQIEQIIQRQVQALGETHPLVKPNFNPERHRSILDTPLDQITEVKI